MLDDQQLETAGFGSKTALRPFPFESPEGDFADEARNFSCRICSIDKPPALVPACCGRGGVYIT